MTISLLLRDLIQQSVSKWNQDYEGRKMGPPLLALLARMGILKVYLSGEKIIISQ